MKTLELYHCTRSQLNDINRSHIMDIAQNVFSQTRVESNYLRLLSPEGFLEAELSTPTDMACCLLLPHPNNFLADARYTTQLPVLHRQGIGTFCCNIRNLNDHINQPNLISDTAALTERLLHFLDAARPFTTHTPLVLAVCNQLAAAAIRVAVMRDTQISGVICHGGRPNNAGARFLNLLQTPVFQAEPLEKTGLLPPPAIEWIHQHCKFTLE